MDLYNLLNSKSKFFNIFLNFTFLLMLIFGLIFYKDVFGNESASFYIFSTVVQGFLALVAFLGTLTVFKIQLIENEAQKISLGLEESLKLYKGIEVHSYSWIETMNVCGEILENKESTWQIYQIKTGYHKLCKLRDEKSPIRNTMVDFSILSLVNIMIALVGISISPVLIKNEFILANCAYTFLVLILSFYSSKIAFKVIKSCLGYSYSITI